MDKNDNTLEPLIEATSPAVAKAMKRFDDLYSGRAQLSLADQARLDEHGHALELEFAALQARLDLLHTVRVAWRLDFAECRYAAKSTQASCLGCGALTVSCVWACECQAFPLCETCWTEVSREPGEETTDDGTLADPT